MKGVANLAPHTWARPLQPLPLFEDRNLLYRTGLHHVRCAKKPCRCARSTSLLGVTDLVEVLELSDEGAWVRRTNHHPVWVERQGLVPTEPPTHEVRQSPIGTRPPDFELLDQLLSRGLPAYPRRRRFPQGGDIVFVRADLQAGRINPWRFLCETQRDNQPVALLIDPALLIEHALHPSWVQRTEVEITKQLGAILLCAYPLPDGTDSPGWTR